MTDPQRVPTAGSPDADSDDAPMTISREMLSVSTAWAEAGRIRLRRRVVTETRTVQVTVRREDLHVQVHNVDERDGILRGSDRDGPIADAPERSGPIVIVLQEEIPVVSTHRQPYEMVTVAVDVVTRTGRISTALQHEELHLDETSNLKSPADPTL